MLQEELQEGKIEEIPKEQVKWWNPTFLVPKPSGEWRKILEASLLNEEIQPLHFQMNRFKQVRYLLIPNDWAVTLDLKSAFHQLIVYPPHRAYQVLEVHSHHYQYRKMLFGYNHSQIFFTQALTLPFTEIRKRTYIRIINLSDDLPLFPSRQKLAFLPNTAYNKFPEAFRLIKGTAALIERPNFLRIQFREASLYLMRIDSTRTKAVKTQGWT
ncbi:MAG: hypothetical protein EZS28_028545 [Streblomastix strix]|uniref:Reverse transcriptase domain-containing protein n=1 Tax=Streblomastix strix TaxID=222440 RepID=A0A5J4UZI7_9EUKA|nr:MAG: hypothetical protein EZS28_028545 [Streblomastix strix]